MLEEKKLELETTDQKLQTRNYRPETTDQKLLSPHTDLRKRKHVSTRRRPSHRQRRTERREDKHPLHLRQYIIRSRGVGKNLIVLHAPLRVHIRLDHQRV